MSQPFIGQLTLFPYTFAPVGYLFCQGQLLPISQYDALFNLIGTIYGGDGQATFALPDLRGRTPIGTGQSPGTGSYVIGEVQGVESVTLIGSQMPIHTHLVGATSVPFNSAPPDGCIFGSPTVGQPYGTGGSAASLAPASLTPAFGNGPHENRQPYLGVNWAIAYEGIYPTPG